MVEPPGFDDVLSCCHRGELVHGFGPRPTAGACRARDRQRVVSTGCFLLRAAGAAEVRSPPDGRIFPSRHRTWRHSHPAGGRGRRPGCRLRPVGLRIQSVPPKTSIASWVHSFRPGPPKTSFYSRLNLPSFSGETSYAGPCRRGGLDFKGSRILSQNGASVTYTATGQHRFPM